MTASRRGASPAGDNDLDEREVDLARWRRAIVALWWIPIAGLVAGAILGLLFSLRGSSTYKASALISLGQPVSPGGVVIASFGTNPRAVSQIVSSASAQAQAEHAATMRSGALRGHVSVAQVGTATGAGAARATPLISLTVQGAQPKKAEGAANALARRVVLLTTAPYVGTKIKTYNQVLETTNRQLQSISDRIAHLNKAVATSHLAALDELVLISQVDNAEQRQGNLFDQEATTNQQLAFALNVESAKIVADAAPVKASAHSKRTSLVIGALIGLLVGGIAAIAAYGRVGRLSPA
jgi:uncharacterized protein involved in exopolysaccharide biosynthesis